jgi:holliday junction DNA helicase RuvB
MEVKKISTTQHTTPVKQSQSQTIETTTGPRPVQFEEFVGQDNIVSVVQTAITSAQKSSHTLGHMLFSGPSWHGKTTLAHIIATEMHVTIKAITGYAISKPSEIISILNNLQPGDILFIDEIHRLKPTIEEVLYIAMEDRVIDFVMPEGGSMRLPINPFTLIGATTKMESLSSPLKNRFVYKFHFVDYTKQEILGIVQHYLNHYSIQMDPALIGEISKKVEHTPREIHNICVKIRDYLTAHGAGDTLTMHRDDRSTFESRLQVDEGGITALHRQYLDILGAQDEAVGLTTIAAKLGMHEKAIEQDIEPLLLKLGKILKTTRGRTLAI